MKKIFALFTIMTLTLAFSVANAQRTLSSEDLLNKYTFYKENPTPFQKRTLSFDEWKVKHNYVQKNDDLQKAYNSYYNKTIGAMSFEDWKSKIENSVPSSGDYLIKARNQILSGIGLQIFASGFALVMSNVYSNKIADIDINHIQEINLIENQRNACFIGAGILSLVGFGFELSGFNNIGKAGLSLNANGIGVKVKF